MSEFVYFTEISEVNIDGRSVNVEVRRIVARDEIVSVSEFEGEVLMTVSRRMVGGAAERTFVVKESLDELNKINQLYNGA